jgi:hypothetical protein
MFPTNFVLYCECYIIFAFDSLYASVLTINKGGDEEQEQENSDGTQVAGHIPGESP